MKEENWGEKWENTAQRRIVLFLFMSITVSMWHRYGEYIAYGNLPKFKPKAVNVGH